MANKEASLLLRIKTAGQEALDSLSESFGTIKEAGLIAFGAISAAIYKSISEYKESEAATNELTRAMVNNGTYSKAARDAYLEQADALSKLTLFGDEHIVKAQAAFSQQTKGLNLTKEQTMAMLDFAQAQGMDAAQAAEVLGKAVGTSNNALARYGIEVSSTADKSLKLDQAIAGLNSKFGGQASAATQGLGGLDMLKKGMDDVFKAIGEKIAPTIGVVIKHINELLSSGDKVGSFVDAFSTGFNVVLGWSYRLAEGIEVLGEFIGYELGTAISVMSELMSGNFSKAKDIIVNNTKDMAAEVMSIHEQWNSKISELDAAAIAKKQDVATQEEDLLRQTLENKRIIETEDRALKREEEMNHLVEKSAAETEMELALLSGKNSTIYSAQVAQYDKEYKLANTQLEKNAALKKKHDAQQKANQAKIDEENLRAAAQHFGYISSLQSSKLKEMAAIGKAAAISEATINGYNAVSAAFKWGMTFGGPPLAAAFGGAAAIAAAANVAKVAGVPLAEGGIVMPRPGGTQATIGEAGQAEAVIPLDRAGEFGLGGGGSTQVIINVQGGLLGSESEAREFALAVDKELLKLRRNNESLSFDSGVI